MKFIQMTVLIITGGIGLITAILMGKVTKNFQHKCILYGSLRVRQGIAQGRQILSLDAASSWGETSACDFVTFEGVLVFMNAFIWTWFYIHMESIIRMDETDTTAVSPQNGGSAQSRPIPRSLSVVKRDSPSHAAIFVLPPIIINSLLCLTSIVRASYITEGYHEFCDDICTVSGQACLHDSDMCMDLQKQNWTFLSGQSPSPMYHDIMTAAITLSWFEPLALAIHVVSVIVEVYLLFKPTSATNSNSNSYSGRFDTGSCVPLWPNASGDEDEVEEEVDDSKVKPTESNTRRSPRPKFSRQSREEDNPTATLVSGFDNPYVRKRPVPSKSLPDHRSEKENVTVSSETSPSRSAAASSQQLWGAEVIAASVHSHEKAGIAHTAQPQSLEVEAQINGTTQNTFNQVPQVHAPSPSSADC
ncbi:hypothetical protein V1264_018135 [Littorina saxatilis]|uniref:Uncharacterized protein n=3 Tax=Littorina saxatilis TaxID=31220 RepID=A0AAN9GDT9_9CAEN